MAHVLLPCDLPTWSEIQSHLGQVKDVKTSEDLVGVMSKIYDICSISLEPEDIHQQKKPDPRPRFEELKTFLDDILSPDERNRFFSETLPNIVSAALCLEKPEQSFLYSIKREDEIFELDRSFVKSLLANSFFSTFPRRTPKTHPCLQNFAFGEFFLHLYRRSQQKKLKAFFRYFQRNEDRWKNPVRFYRKVLTGTGVLSLPGWLCSDRALVPLIVRPEGNLHKAEPHICRAFLCSSLVGGDVLQGSTSTESSLFFAFPELLCCLCFLEQLEDNEAVIAEGVIPYGIRKSRHSPSYEVSICLMDGTDFNLDSDQQFEDKFLLRELNKALAGFSHQTIPSEEDPLYSELRRQTPVGESSSSERRSSASSCSKRDSLTNPTDIRRWKTTNLARRCDVGYEEIKCERRQSEPKKTNYLPPISSITGHSLEGHQHCPKDTSSSNDNTSNQKMAELPKLLGQTPVNNVQHSDSLKRSTSSSLSSTRSIKTASESSLELPPILRSVPLHNMTSKGEEVYYTADEDSDRSSDRILKVGQMKSNKNHGEANLTSLLISTSGLVNEQPTERRPPTVNAGSSSSDWTKSKESSSGLTSSLSKRSDSAGFVLGGGGSDEDIEDFALDETEEQFERGPQIHERLDDFRKRIRHRTRRHLSRKMRSGSRSSYSLGSSTSSDMEDISEEEDFDVSFQAPRQNQVMRTSSSEPSLVNVNEEIMDIPPFSPGADTVVLSLGGRKVLVTSSNGQLKAYSYDGVNPNLPVPFKAKFRTRRKRHPSADGDTRDILWTSHEFGLVDETRSCSVTDSDEEQSHPFSSLLSRELRNPRANSFDAYYPNFQTDLVSNFKGKSPVAVSPTRNGDTQVRALLLWLAASMAGLPSLICYTAQEPQLYELNSVYRKVLSRHWTIGDLACEVLRFCRNKLSPRRKFCPATIFEQLLNTGTGTNSSTPISYRQHSLD